MSLRRLLMRGLLAVCQNSNVEQNLMHFWDVALGLIMRYTEPIYGNLARMQMRGGPDHRDALPSQDNFEFGDATQLVGGYTAGYLVVSCVTALAYLGLWLRCLVQMRRQDRGDLEGGTAGAAVARGGPLEPAAGGIKGTAILIRLLGPWLWPVALIHTCATIIPCSKLFYSSL